MPGIAGKKHRLRTSPTNAGTYSLVTGIKSVTCELDLGTTDDNEFGVDAQQRIGTITDFKLTAQGSFRAADTLGQIALRNALLTATQVFVKSLPDDGTTVGIGVQGAVWVTKFSVDPAVDGISAVTIEMTGSGVITSV